jgi:uncharacterized protein
MVAFFFRRLGVRALVVWGVALVLIQLVVMSASAAYAHSLAAAMSRRLRAPQTVQEWNEFAGDFAVPSADRLQEILALHLGPWTGIVHEQVTEHLADAFLLRTSFRSGDSRLHAVRNGGAKIGPSYRSVGGPALRASRADRLRNRHSGICGLCWMLFADGFTVPGIFTWYMAATIPFRPIMVRRLCRADHPADEERRLAGRSNRRRRPRRLHQLSGHQYRDDLCLLRLGARPLRVSRPAELWLVVLAMWVVMLAWSKPWLDRFATARSSGCGEASRAGSFSRCAGKSALRPPPRFGRNPGC